MPFNEAQTMAVQHGKGPMMVLAGPGSGKTTVIVGRVRNLVENLKVSPSSILVITFTRAAAREMEEVSCFRTGKQQWKGQFWHLPLCIFPDFKACLPLQRRKYRPGRTADGISAQGDCPSFLRGRG